MAKTFNRPPLQVNTPSSNDTKERFFSHYNWKGVNKNKNFLAVDQETFADSNNVYIADDGTLRSRPAIKKSNLFNFTNVVDVETFENVVVYKTLDDDVLKLHFVVEDGVSEKSFTLNSRNHKLLKADNKIFIFTENGLSYFDVDNESFYNGTDYVYVPTTTFDAAGVKTKSEEKNLLTDSEVFVYLYNNVTGVSAEVYGKTVEFTIQGETYSVLFDDKAPDLIADRKFVIPEGFDVIEVSSNDTYLFYSTANKTLVYSATGQIFTKEWTINTDDKLIVSPKFSQDGGYIVYATNKDIYIVSVLIDNSSGTLRYPEPIAISTYVEELDWVNVKDARLDFVTYDKFAYCYSEGYSGEMFLNVFVYDDRQFYTTFSAESLKINDLCFGDSASVLVYDMENTIVDDDGEIIGSSKETAEIILDKELKSVSKTYYKDKVFVNCKLTNDKIYILYAPKNIDIDETYLYVYDSAKNVVIDIVPRRRVRGIISIDGERIIFRDCIYYINSKELRNLLVLENFSSAASLIGFTDYIYYRLKNTVYSSLIDKSIELKYYKAGDYKNFVPNIVTRLNEFYFGKDNSLYVSNYREVDGKFAWYFPINNHHSFDYNITALIPISTTEVAAFFENEIWYVGKSELGYMATKSKLGLGLKSGSDVTTSYDGKQTLFCSNDGFVALSFQDFVASTDQAATFLSDVLRKDMEDYSKNPVKLFKKGFWLILYHTVDGKGYVFDFRNGSWWPVSCDKSITKIFVYNDVIYLLAENEFYKLDTSSEDYFDDDGKHHTINWFLTSQKLHLSASNYVKHIVNLTLSSVVDDLSLLTYALDVTNYRKTVNTVNTKLLEYKVQAIRTFVQRLNHFKVNEFQYTLKTDLESAIQAPLNVSDISIKYRISGQVR